LAICAPYTTVFRARLDLHAIRPAVEVEVVDIEGGHERLERSEDVAQLHAACFGGGAVHVHVQLRHVSPEIGVHAQHRGKLVRRLDERLHLAREVLHREAATILELRLDPGGGAEAGDLGEVEGEAHRVPHAEEAAVDAAGDGVDRLAGAALLPRPYV